MPDERITALIAEAVGDRLAPAEVEALARQIEGRVQAERLRCAHVCRDRAELWRNTSLAKADLPQAREEARARANEAAWLADLLELGKW